MCFISEPSRIRSGQLTGTSSSTNGSAVTGPTHSATTGPRRAASSSSCMPISCARSSIEITAGAEVKVTPSTSPRAMVRTSSSKPSRSVGGSQR